MRADRTDDNEHTVPTKELCLVIPGQEGPSKKPIRSEDHIVRTPVTTIIGRTH